MLAVRAAILALCLHTTSVAKQIAEDIKDIILQSQNEETHLQELVKMVLRTTATPAQWAVTPDFAAPYFELGPGPHNVSARLGAPVTLHCRVLRLDDQFTVSWLRREGGELKLLAVGLEAYSIGRYTPSRGLDDWRLTIDRASSSDQGIYECHVSSHLPITLSFHLTVIVPEVVMGDERGLPMEKKLYNSGSTIELTCVVNGLGVAGGEVSWRHNGRLLNTDTSRGGISVKTDLAAEEGSLVSRLFAANTGPSDSGNYTCAVDDVASATVSVIVLNGESAGEAPAAMHVGSAPRHLPVFCISITILGAVVFSSKWS